MLNIKREVRYIHTNQKTKGITQCFGQHVNLWFHNHELIMFLSALYQKDNSLSELLRDSLQKVAPWKKAETHIFEISEMDKADLHSGLHKTWISGFDYNQMEQNAGISKNHRAHNKQTSGVPTLPM